MPNFELLQRALRERIVILDGAMGTTIRSYGLGEAEIRGERFKDSKKDLKNNGDLYSLTQPGTICDIHRRFLEAGADIIETNTFSATSIGQSEFFVETNSSMTLPGKSMSNPQSNVANGLTALPTRLANLASSPAPSGR